MKRVARGELYAQNILSSSMGLQVGEAEKIEWLVASCTALVRHPQSCCCIGVRTSSTHGIQIADLLLLVKSLGSNLELAMTGIP